MVRTFAERVIAAVASTHAVIDLDAYASNVQVMRSRLRALGNVQMMAVVKANAYGHGAVMCARTAIDAGADRLGVARIEEGLMLREHGITAPILALGPFNPLLISRAASENIAITIGSPDGLERIRPALEELDDGSLEVHLKVDTGMHRYGVYPSEAADIARDLVEEPAIRYAGLFTHFATADEAEDSFLQEQQRRFVETVLELTPEGLVPPLLHMSNSAASLRNVLPPELLNFNLAFRPGLALYGLSPSEDVPAPKELHRVMTLKTRIGRIFRLEPGEGVSYGLTHVAKVPTLCATVPVGYGDGLNRHLSNRGWMSVKGRRCPILGRICMDQVVIDITTVAQPEEGDEVVVFGDGKGNSMTADNAAKIIGTINYEVITAILPRVPRIYQNFGEIVAVEDLHGLIEKP
jgi:alanine racemase